MNEWEIILLFYIKNKFSNNFKFHSNLDYKDKIFIDRIF